MLKDFTWELSLKELLTASLPFDYFFHLKLVFNVKLTFNVVLGFFLSFDISHVVYNQMLLLDYQGFNKVF